MKKILTFIVFIAALTAIIFVYFNEKSKINEKVPLYNAIPNQFPIAIESANWQQLLTKLDTLSFNETINQQDWYVGAKVNLEYINKLKLMLIENNQQVNLSNALIAYGNAGNSRLGILLAVSVDNFNLSDFEKLLKTNNIKFISNNFDAQKIITLKKFNNQSEASLSFKNGILLFSFQASFIEEALISLNQSSSWTKLVKDFTHDCDAFLYLNAKSVNYLSSYLLKPKYFSVLNELDAITNNAVYQLEFFSDEIILNGYTSAGTGDLLEIFKSNIARSNDIVDFLPSNTAFYTTYSKSDSLSNTTSFINNNIAEILNEQYASFILETYNEKIEERSGLVLALNDVETIEYLREIDKNITENSTSYNYQIYKSSMGVLLNKSLHLNDLLKEGVFFSIVDDFLIVSSNLTVVEQFINKYLENDFLKFDKSYTEFKHSFSNKSNLDIYLNLEYLQAYLSQISTENTWQNNISMVNFQFSNLGDRMFSQGKINLNKSTNENTKILWSTKLDTISSYRTQLVINHNNNETEIMTQDDAGNLYLFSKSGELIWKIKIADLILSEIYQIDYYDNNKYQYIFNTQNKIYVIDRNGDNVDGFPIELPGKASNEMLVVNYDNAGVYRYFVASDNGNVYGYEQNGSPLAGWNPKTNVGVLTNKIKHDMVDGLDYIYFSNNEGYFYAFNRKGELRFNPVKTNVINNLFSIKDHHFVSGNKGMVTFIDFKGVTSTKAIADSTYVYFIAEKSLLQETDAYAFANSSNFKLQESQWKNLASFSKVEGGIRKIESFITNNKLWFFIYTNNAVYLIDEQGNLHPKFPLLTYADVRVVPLIEGKDRLIIYSGLDANLNVMQIKWSSL